MSTRDSERQRDVKAATRIGRSVHVDFAMMQIHDALGDREAHAGAFVFADLVQAPKQLEYALFVLDIEANAIVFEGDDGFVLFVFFFYARTHVNVWSLAFAAKLDRVVEQALKQLLQQLRVCLHSWQ